VEFLQRLQPLDLLFALALVAIVGWGLQTGFVRQIGVVIGIYVAFLLAGSLYQPIGGSLTPVVGQQQAPLMEFLAYVAIMVGALVTICWLIWQAFPPHGPGADFGLSNVLGAAIAAAWGLLFLIALLTVLRYYAVVPWRDQELTQSTVRRQLQQSQAPPMLERVATPWWQIMSPWFPAAVEHPS
jgi:hypothetical protein